MKTKLQIGVVSVLAGIVFGAPTVAAENTFTHEHLTLTLPEGWSSAKVPEGSKDTIGVLKSSKIAGTSITLDCYRGRLHTEASTRIRGLGTISAAYPDGQEQLKKPKRFKGNGIKGTVELWRGYVKAGNLIVKLQSPMAAAKTKHCWLVMTGFTPESSGPALETDFMTILESAR